MRYPKKITEKVAEAFIENPENFDLSQVTEIAYEAAPMLVDYAAEHPSLDVLHSLSKLDDLTLNYRVLKPEHAKVIASFRGRVWLDGFRKISDESARELSGFNGEMLRLGIEVRNLSKEAARSLCEVGALLMFSRGDTFFVNSRLREKADFDFDSEADRAPKHLDIDFIRKWERGPSAFSLAHALTIDDEAAEALSIYGEKEWGGSDSVHQIDLSDLTELSEISVDHLANAVRGQWAWDSYDWILLKGDLKARVSGITKFTIGEEIAKLWIQDNEMAGDNKGESDRLINLSNFNDISDKAALLLSKFDGALPLGGVTELSDVAAEALSKYEGTDLKLWGLTSLTDAAAESLSKCKGKWLFLSGITTLSDAAANSLSNYEGGALKLQGLTELSDVAAESLSKFEGALDCCGLTSLRCKHLSDKLIGNSGRNDEFSKLIEISDAVAESLAGDVGYLNLSDLALLSDAAAESFSKCEGYLKLDGLVSLSDTAAKFLSKNKGRLYLNGLTELSDAAANHLSKHKGPLYKGGLFLNGLTSLSDTAAESLSKYKGDSLELAGLTNLSPTAAKHLLKSKKVTTKLNLKKIAKG